MTLYTVTTLFGDPALKANLEICMSFLIPSANWHFSLWLNTAVYYEENYFVTKSKFNYSTGCGL